MRFYWGDTDEVWQMPFGAIPPTYWDGVPYLCVYLMWELDAYTAGFKTEKVGMLMAERYIRKVLQPAVGYGEVLLAKDYP